MNGRERIVLTELATEMIDHGGPVHPDGHGLHSDLAGMGEGLR